MNIKDLKISSRLGILSAFLIISMVIVAFTGWRATSQGNERLQNISESATALQNAVNQARESQVLFKTQIQEWKNILLRGNDPDLFTRYNASFAENGEKAQATLADLEKNLAALGIAAPLVGDARAALAELQHKYLDALKQYDSNRTDTAQLVDGLVKGMDRAPTEKIDGIVEFVAESSASLMKKNKQEADKQYQATVLLLIVVVGIAAAIGVVASIMIVKGIVNPIGNAVKIAEAVAAGDLRNDITVSGKDETGQLMSALKRMNDGLLQIVSQVRTGTDTISTASSEIASGNLDLSSRTEEQASSLEETAASMEELTSTVKQNADNARQANQLAQSASDVAVKGGAVVSQVVHTMEDINASAKKIVDIISVIDGIAFQTNILALNAAVEAARAGEQGRGFAVVASEVRSLAQRSASAAKEIKELIGTSVEKVDTGSKLVEQAGTTMQEIVESVKRVTDIMAEIAAASQEQSAGIEQVNQAIAQMDQATQQNAALVEEAAAAAESLSNQASSLEQVVSVFRIDTNSVSATAAPLLKPKQPLALAKNSSSRKPSTANGLPKKAEREAVAVGDWEEF